LFRAVKDPKSKALQSRAFTSKSRSRPGCGVLGRGQISRGSPAEGREEICPPARCPYPVMEAPPFGAARGPPNRADAGAPGTGARGLRFQADVETPAPVGLRSGGPAGNLVALAARCQPGGGAIDPVGPVAYANDSAYWCRWRR
jgi:hypothetical protein